jgi:acylphosphatase
MEAQKAVGVNITGRVQGVGFRAWTQREARRLGLAGWVRNERDGTVAALLVGDEAAVATMLRLLRQGPASAHVSDLRVEEMDSVDRSSGFSVTE